MANVTVVIALYNKSRYVKACLDSVLNQTYKDIEVILVDDGSTDNSLYIVKQITDPRLKVISQKNAGPGIARNRGIDLCTSPFITFIDADDTWDPSFIETGLKALNQNIECDLFLCAASWEPLGQIRHPFFPNEKVQPGPWNVPFTLSADEVFKCMNFFATGAVLSKTEVIKRYGGYFSKVKCTSGEDGYLWVQVMVNHKIVRSEVPLLKVNTEGSDLGIGRKKLKPIPPILTYPQPLITNCPKNHKENLQKLLDLVAFYSIRRELYQLHIKQSWKLWKEYPGINNHIPDDYPSFPSAFVIIPIQKLVGKISGKAKLILKALNRKSQLL